ncbi:hypothetical protein ENBRE01_3037 [Enteropsectra breve]|nr:hypothetical protein ENBRE01_3037 [Enteropsectra breve]
MTSVSQKKNRQYKPEFIRYGFIPCPTNQALPMCLICEKSLSNEAMKPSRLQDHLIRVHPDKKDNDINYFKELEDKINKRTKLSDIFKSSRKQSFDGLVASYNLSLLIAKSGKPHTIGEEIILPAVKEVLENVLHKPAGEILDKISLSNDTVQKRIDEMADYIEESLCEYLKRVQFSIQLDESTLPNNKSILLSFVRFIKDEKICEELLFVKELQTDTRGRSIFNILKNFFEEKEIPFKNILSVATDGAPSMTGLYNGFVALLKQVSPNVLAVHCVIHRQHLVAKNLSERLHASLNFVISAVNKIKNSALKGRLFSKLCAENDEEFNTLLYHTEVRWLSKGNCLARFYNLFDTVIEFLENSDKDLRENLLKFKSDIAYLADLYKLYNEVNLQRQGDDLNLIKTKNIIASFIAKLLLYKRNIAVKNFLHFPKLQELNNVIRDHDLEIYCQHLEDVHKDFGERFKDILEMEVPFWILNPFEYEANLGSPELEEELIELTTNEELKYRFSRGYQYFWLQKPISSLYTGLWKIAQKYLVAFPSSYLSERGFSAVTTIFSKKKKFTAYHRTW